jgi:hypothetical protein
MPVNRAEPGNHGLTGPKRPYRKELHGELENSTRESKSTKRISCSFP